MTTTTLNKQNFRSKIYLIFKIHSTAFQYLEINPHWVKPKCMLLHTECEDETKATLILNIQQANGWPGTKTTTLSSNKRNEWQRLFHIMFMVLHNKFRNRSDRPTEKEQKMKEQMWVFECVCERGNKENLCKIFPFLQEQCSVCAYRVHYE